MSKPLVSIVLLTYNSSKYVVETLESIKYQTYDNLELIVSDDGSTDNTISVCEKWIQKNLSVFKRVELVTSPENTGTVKNINRACEYVKGEWIKPLGGDDILVKECIDIFVKDGIKKSKIIVSDYKKFYSDGSSYIILDVFHKNNYYKKFFLNENSSIDIQLKCLAKIKVGLPGGVFFINTKFLREIDYFDEDYYLTEDTPLLFRALLHGTNIYYIDKHTIYYRKAKNSATTRISEEFFHDINLTYYKYRKPVLTKFDILYKYDFFVKKTVRSFYLNSGKRQINTVAKLIYLFSPLFLMYQTKKLFLQLKAFVYNLFGQTEKVFRIKKLGQR